MTEIPEPVDTRNNPESRAAEEQVSPSSARASAGGPPPKDAPAAGEAPEQSTGGVADGSPVAGVEITEEDLHDAVPGDTGPDELGHRGPQTQPIR